MYTYMCVSWTYKCHCLHRGRPNGRIRRAFLPWRWLAANPGPGGPTVEPKMEQAIGGWWSWWWVWKVIGLNYDSRRNLLVWTCYGLQCYQTKLVALTDSNPTPKAISTRTKMDAVRKMSDSLGPADMLKYKILVFSVSDLSYRSWFLKMGLIRTSSSVLCVVTPAEVVKHGKAHLRLSIQLE